MPVLTDNDDLLRLVKLASSGDNEALSLLVSKMIPDVRREASKFSGAVGVDSDDLFQEGMIGLLSAARSYKTDCGASFRTYASVCIRNRIISAVKKASGGKSVRRDLLKQSFYLCRSFLMMTVLLLKRNVTGFLALSKHSFPKENAAF